MRIYALVFKIHITKELSAPSVFGIMPIEVKSKEKYRAAGLKEYIEKYSPVKAVVISGKDYGINGIVTTIPMYFVWVIGDMIPDS